MIKVKSKKPLLQTILAGTFAVFFCIPLFALQTKMDSLLAEFQNAAHDTTRLKIYFSLCHECEMKDNLKYAEPAIALVDKLISQSINQEEKEKWLKQKADLFNYAFAYYGEKNDTLNMRKLTDDRIKIFTSINDTSGVVNTFLDQSNRFSFIGNIPKALEYCQKAWDYSKKLNYQKGIALSLGRMGNIYREIGEYQSALNPFLERLTILENIKDTEYLAFSHLQTGNLYSDLADTTLALHHYRQGKALFEKYGLHRGIIDAYYRIGDMYLKHDDDKNALSNFSQGLTIAEKYNKSNWIPEFLNAFGWAYYISADYNKALEYHLRAYEIVKKGNNDPDQIANTYIKLGLTYLKLQNYSKAKEFSSRYLNMVKEGNYSSGVLYGEKLAMEVDSAMGNYKDAFEHYKQYIAVQEKLTSDEVKKKAVHQKYQDEYEKKQAEAKAIQDKKDLQTAEEKRRQTIITYSISAGFLLVVLFAGFIFRSLKITRKQKQIIAEKSIETEKQKQIVESKNKEITDSINYAKRLQQAILPPVELFRKYLPNSFVLYQPKDIVAGDFYWMEVIDHTIFITAADCTGHGVPGAMVSVVCSNALNRSVKEFGLRDTGKILDKVTDLVLETFEKSALEVKDGMDISLLAYNMTSKQIQWSGANNPLWYIQNGQVVEIKADKQPVGKFDKRKSFTSHSIEHSDNSVFYLFTDGLPDQFGGPKGKKFMYKRFENNLSDISKLPMDEQQAILEKAFQDWKGSLEQVDDVTVIGIKI